MTRKTLGELIMPKDRFMELWGELDSVYDEIQKAFNDIANKYNVSIKGNIIVDNLKEDEKERIIRPQNLKNK